MREPLWRFAAGVKTKTPASFAPTGVEMYRVCFPLRRDGYDDTYYYDDYRGSDTDGALDRRRMVLANDVVA